MLLTTTLATTKVIKAKNGRVIKIADRIFLKVEKDSLPEDLLTLKEVVDFVLI